MKRAQTPVLSERLLCGAQQVSAEQLSSNRTPSESQPSTHRGRSRVHAIAPFSRSSFPPFFSPTSVESPLPCQRFSVFLSSAGLFTAAGLQQSRSTAPSNTLTLLCPALARCSFWDMSTHSCSRVLPSSLSLPHKPTIDPSQAGRPRRKSSVRCWMA